MMRAAGSAYVVNGMVIVRIAFYCECWVEIALFCVASG
jgi:hypothetical protein